MLFLFAFIVSLVITMVLIPPLIRYAEVIGAIDLPDARKVHQVAIARVGGIAMVIGSVLSILFWSDLDKQAISLFIGFMVLLFFGIWDDRVDLNYRIKFFGQLIAVIIVVIYGEVIVWSLPFYDELLPIYIAIPFTIFALVGITNAINLSDGLDGLAGGTTLLSLCVIALIAFQADGLNVVLIAMAVSGSIFGFLRHNTFPARLFMGDTGSQFLGFSAGALAIMLTQDVNTAISPVLPLIILGLPILDTLAVMFQRVYDGRSPFSPDKNHIHHKLLAIGFDHYEAVLLIYLVQSLLVISAYILRYESDVLLLISYAVFSFSVIAMFHISKKNNWEFHKSNFNNESKIKVLVKWLESSGYLREGLLVLLKIGVPIIFLTSVILPDVIHKQMSLLSMFLLILLFGSLLIFKGKMTIVEKAVSYVVCVISVYFLHGESIINSEYYNLMNYLFILLAIGFALKIRFSNDHSFQITPLDFLVVFLVVVVPNIPDLGFTEVHLGEMALKLIVLFYVTEAVLNIMSARSFLLRMGIISTLMLVIIRGI